MSLLNALLGPSRNVDPTLRGGNILAQQVPETEPHNKFCPESLAVSVLAETPPDEAGKILAVWEDLFGLRLDRERVARRLEDLRQWQKRWGG